MDVLKFITFRKNHMYTSSFQINLLGKRCSTEEMKSKLKVTKRMLIIWDLENLKVYKERETKIFWERST